ncbi:zinc finger and SCAN domain-containing protein 22-like isoform X2 [Engraulis encrasicolus]
MTGQTTLQQPVSGWTDLRLSPETYQQLQVCAQAHTSSTTKEECNRHLPCSIKQEIQVDDTIVLTPPAPDGSWREGQAQVCSIKMERRHTCMLSSGAEDGADSGPHGILLQHPLSPLQSGHQVEPEGRGSSSDLESQKSTDSHMGTLDNPLPDHFLQSLSYCEANPSQNYSAALPMDLHHTPAEKASLALGFTADHGGGEVVGVAAGEATQRPNGSDRQRRYMCRYCEQGFPYLSQLKRHMPKHTKERPYRCGICGFSFMRMSHLKRHERSHTGDRPHACEVCRRCFIRKSHLDQHLKTHRRVEPQHSPLPF